MDRDWVKGKCQGPTSLSSIKRITRFFAIILLLSVILVGCLPIQPVKDSVFQPTNNPTVPTTLPPPTTVPTGNVFSPVVTETLSGEIEETARKTFAKGLSAYLYDIQPVTVSLDNIQQASFTLRYLLSQQASQGTYRVGVTFVDRNGQKELNFLQGSPELDWKAKQGVLTLSLSAAGNSANQNDSQPLQITPVLIEIVLVDVEQNSSQKTIEMKDMSNSVKIEVSGATAASADVTTAPAPASVLQTPSPNAPVFQGIAIAWQGEVIKAGNAAQVRPLAEWGYGKVEVAAFSPDGQTFAVGTSTGVLFYPVDTLLLARYVPTGSNINALAYSPDGTMLAIGMNTGYAICDPGTGQLLPGIIGERSGDVESVAFSPDGELLAVGTTFGPSLLVHSATRQALRTLDEAWVDVIEFSPDGKTLAVASNKGIHLWDIATNKYQKTLHSDRTYSMTFSPDSKILATGGAGIQGVWNLESGENLHAFDWRIPSFNSLAFSPDGKTLIASADNGEVDLWDAQTLKAKGTLNKEKDSIARAFISPDGKRLLTVSLDGALNMMEIAGGKILSSSEQFGATITALAFSPDGQNLAEADFYQKVVLWDPASGKINKILDGYGDRALSAAFSPDGKILAALSGNSGVFLRDTTSGKVIRTIRANTARPVFSPNGKTIAAQDWQNNINLFDAFSGKLLRSNKGESNKLISLAFSPDGKLLAGGGYNDSVFLWDVSNGQVLHKLSMDQNPAESVVFSPNGRILASSGWQSTLVLWDVATGNALLKLNRKDSFVQIKSVAFSSDGSLLAFGSGTEIVLWDTASGQELGVLTGHTLQINSLAFSPDGMVLASAGDDGTIRLWGVGQ